MCSCRKGYKVDDDDEKNCVDVDECRYDAGYDYNGRFVTNGNISFPIPLHFCTSTIICVVVISAYVRMLFKHIFIHRFFFSLSKPFTFIHIVHIVYSLCIGGLCIQMSSHLCVCLLSINIINDTFFSC
jgi:Complement Clr-like EGF-like